MTTATPTMKPTTPPARPGAPAPGHGAMGMVSIDPMRLLRRYYPLLVAATVFGAAVGLACHLVLLRVYPVWTATAVFECRAQATNPRELGTQIEGADAMMRFMGTQVAIMTSDDILANALKDPELLNTAWYRQFRDGERAKAMQRLTKDVNARVRTNTSLITLNMSWHKPTDAAVVVNAVTRAYMQELEQTGKRASIERRDALNSRLRDISREKDRLNQARERLLQENKVTDIEGQQTEENMQIQQIAEKLVQIRATRATITSLQQKYNEILKLQGTKTYPDELMAEARRDPIIQETEQQIASMKIDERALLARGIGEEHDAIRALRNRIESAQREVDTRRDTLLSRLFDSRLDQFRSEMAALDEQERELDAKLKSANTRKEDLVRILVRVKQMATDLEALTKEETEIAIAMKDTETLSSARVFDRVRVLRMAQTPDRVTFPKWEILIPLGVVLCTGLVGGAIVLRELLDQRVRGPSDVAIIPRLTVLGMVPEASEDPARPKTVETSLRDTPGGVVSESFRQIRAPLIKRMDQEGRRTLLVLAGMPGSGATTVVSNMALACASAGERVLVIDANLRRPAMHRVFRLSEGPGLGDVLVGQATFEQAVQDSGTPNLSVVTAGALANRTVPERLSSEAMTRVLNEAAARYDRVILDAPPAIVAGDGLALANCADAVVLVVRAMNEKRGLVNRLRIQLSEARGELLGVVVNAVRASAGGYFKRNIRATHDYQTQAK